MSATMIFASGATSRRRELQERERSKSAAVIAALQQALEQRGTTPAVARATAQVTTIAFGNAFEQWIEHPRHATFAACLEAAATTLRSALTD